jgi:NAD-specific glutamate dehydrogenase
MEKKVEEKLELYCEIYNRLYEKISKMNPEHAVEIALTMLQEVARDLRREQMTERRMRENPGGDTRSDGLATKKQREAMHKFGVKRIPEDLSKEEASEILERLIGFSKEGDSDSIAKTVEELNQKWRAPETQPTKK